MRCRSCNNFLEAPFLNLGLHPLSNAFVKMEKKEQGEMFYPLEVFACKECWLVQLSEPATREDIFTDDYVYFSSYSSSWLQHAETFALAATKNFNLNSNSLVMEIASNDGYLLQFFKTQNIPVLGVEPSASVAKVALQKGVPTKVDFFGEKTATKLVSENGKADLIAANNVLAHVPDLHDFLKGFKICLKASGVISFEFPHLLSLIKNVQFDTVYHEHFSYLSLTALEPLFTKLGLQVFDVEKLPTHGGSLRLWVKHSENENIVEKMSVKNILLEETREGLNSYATFESFNQKVQLVRENLLKFLIAAQKDNKKVCAYGAAAKGNTLLNYCGIRADLIKMVADKNPVKQGRLLPGSRIPVVSPEELLKSKPDFVLILPWNLKVEIADQLSEVRKWEGQFIVPVPSLEVF